MRVPLSWLREYVDFDLSPQELAERLTLAGMEVSSIEVSGADWTDVVVGRLLDVAPHPNAEKLTLTRVDAGTGETLEIVCGANNIAPGQLVPVALPGAVLPGGRRIVRSRIRGVESQGMLCSADELGLGTDADGILILGTADEQRIGTDLRSLFGEAVLDVDVKPNRGDALSMVGLAREVAAFSGSAVRMPQISVAEAGDRTDAHVAVRVDEPVLCPRFTARYFDGVRNAASPEWMQRRLIAAGMRPISAIVDVTNYVMHELGQPMHAYDADRIPGGEIVVRRARDGEALTTIDHEERRLDASMLVIADAQRAIGLAGIMGGAGTEVTEVTERVILESAIFHGPTIRNTARRMALRSEASSRHEKGIDWELPRRAADRAARLISEITGARIAAGIVDSDASQRPLREIELDVARTERLLGIPLDEAAVSALLAPLGFGARGEEGASASGRVRVTVPSHRLDVTEPADLAEEIARAYGYARIPGRLPSAPLPEYRRDPSEPRHRIRRVLGGLGLDEVVTPALISADDLEQTGYPRSDAGLIRVANPVSEDHSILRPLLYPSLLRALRDNVRQRRASVALFELGKVYWMRGAETAPRDSRSETAGTGRYEAWELGIVLSGSIGPPSAHRPSRDADVEDAKGLVDALHRALGAAPPRYRNDDGERRHAHAHPGRAAAIVDAEGVAYGSLSELHPRVAARWDLPGRPVLAALAVERLLALVPARQRAAAIPAAQPIDRNLAVVVDEAVAVGDLLSVVRQAAGPLLADLHLFDVYRGEQIGPGRVSYALALRFQPLIAGDEASVDKAMGKVRGSVRHRLAAHVRE